MDTTIQWSSVHWTNVFISAGAIATVVAFAYGVVIAQRYRRRATVSITADVHVMPIGFVMAARPSVRSDGSGRIKFTKQNGAVLSIAEMLDDCGTVMTGNTVVNDALWPAYAVGAGGAIDGGETLTTSRVIHLTPSSGRVLGWLVACTVQIPRWRPLCWAKPWVWTDVVFVPLPASGGNLRGTRGGSRWWMKVRRTLRIGV